jgi:hypothetical protein
MLESLSTEQTAKLDVYKDTYLAKFYGKDPKDIDEAAIATWFKWLYKFSNLDEPEIHIVDSPRAAQLLANDICGTKKKFYTFATYGNSWDLGWLSFYKYFQEECDIKYDVAEDFNQYHKIVDLGVFESIQLDGACIISKLPSQVEKRGDVIHCADDAAIKFLDGYSLFFWMGVIVPEKLIMHPESITKEDILKEDNAEVRRAFREKLGGVAYYDLLSNGKGLTEIDKDMDEQGFEMTLFETTLNDDITDSKVQFIQVTCPSTERVYDIYPPNQQSTNVWEAKASTFNNAKLMYRHGDVGFKKVGEEPDKPLIET